MRPAKGPPTSAGRDKHVVAVLVLPDSVVLEVAVALQVFGDQTARLTNPSGGTDIPYEIVLCGEAPRHVLPLGADFGELAPLDTLPTADTVIVPGVENPLAARSSALLHALRSAHTAGARMVSFCGGAFVLARAGILDGRRATTHWLFAEEFRTAFPQVHLKPDLLYIDDGPVHTSGGVFSATDLSLHLLALDLGQAYANDVARVLVSAPHRPGGQAQFFKDSVRTGGEPSSDSFLSWLRDHVNEPLTLADLARHERTSERTLIRRFRQATGMSVFDWITRERLNQAKALLETTDFSITEIAAMVGFGSYEAFRRNFETRTGTTASAYRSPFHAEASPRSQGA